MPCLRVAFHNLRKVFRRRVLQERMLFAMAGHDHPTTSISTQRVPHSQSFSIYNSRYEPIRKSLMLHTHLLMIQHKLSFSEIYLSAYAIPQKNSLLSLSTISLLQNASNICTRLCMQSSVHGIRMSETHCIS